MPRVKQMMLIGSLVVAGGCAPLVAESHSTQPAPAMQPAPAIRLEFRRMAATDISEAIRYLLAAQNADGGWGQPFSMPAFTGLVLKDVVQHPDYDRTSAEVARGGSNV